MKRCSKCKERKPFDQFNKKASTKDGLNSWCKSCARADAKRYYRNNPEPYKERARLEGKTKAKQRIAECDQIKAAIGCQCCGESLLCVLDFHHLTGNSKGKDDGMPVTRAAWKSRKCFLEELAKCIVVCANCHRKIHAGFITLPDGIETCKPLGAC